MMREAKYFYQISVQDEQQRVWWSWQRGLSPGRWLSWPSSWWSLIMLECPGSWLGISATNYKFNLCNWHLGASWFMIILVGFSYTTDLVIFNQFLAQMHLNLKHRRCLLQLQPGLYFANLIQEKFAQIHCFNITLQTLHVTLLLLVFRGGERHVVTSLRCQCWHTTAACNTLSQTHSHNRWLNTTHQRESWPAWTVLLLNFFNR